jgi:DNA-binding Lrp family transcriptional regulator
MAVNVSAWVWTLKLPVYDKMVMLELADHADTDGYCFPSQRKIAERTGIHRVTVNTIIKRMEKRGLLTQTHRFVGGQQRASEYRLSIGITLHISEGGCSAGLPLGVAEDYSGGSAGLHHIETSLETSNETSVSVESDAKEFPVKIEDVLNEQKQSNSKQKIFDRYKATPKGCADFWRDARSAAADDNGFQAELLVKEFKMLDNARKRVGDDFPHIVWKVMEDWVAFAKHAEKHTGAYKVGLNPTVRQFCLHIEAAADFYQQNKPVQLTAKPLTKQSAPSKPKPKAKKPQKKVMTFAEAQAAFEEAHKK